MRKKRLNIVIIAGIFGFIIGLLFEISIYFLFIEKNNNISSNNIEENNKTSDNNQIDDNEIVLDNDNENDDNFLQYNYQDEKTNQSNIQYAGFSNVMIKGYATISKKYSEEDEWCYEKENECQNISYDNYVYFHILESSDTTFNEFLKEINGNSYDDENVIGLGCIKGDKIEYLNASDNFFNNKNDNEKRGDVSDYFKTFTLSIDDTNKIINSTKDNPVKLRLDKLPFSSGFGGFNCISLITYVSIEQ